MAAEGRSIPNEEAPLYDQARAGCLQRREKAWERENAEKFTLIRDHIGPCRRLVDIGCGWGQLLRMVSGQVDEVWGVDESPERVKDTKQVCPRAKVVVCKADHLELPDGFFDAAIASQMLHEVVLFGAEGELEAVLGEILRVLTPRGRFILLDHADAGAGEVAVELPKAAVDQLVEFETKFRYYRASHLTLESGQIRLSKRCLQDFLTKTWASNSSMESMEMNETHNVFAQVHTTRQVEAAGFSVVKWTPFSDIRDDIRRIGGRLIEGDPWFRKFVLVGIKPSGTTAHATGHP